MGIEPTSYNYCSHVPTTELSGVNRLFGQMSWYIHIYCKSDYAAGP